MTPYLVDPDVTLYQGDALEVLRELPDESVDCCVTSPPYLGLRDYKMEGQIGLEPTIAEYAASHRERETPKPQHHEAVAEGLAMSTDAYGGWGPVT